MKQEILDKYSIPVPRYTSYPPANFFNDLFTAKTYRKAIIKSNKQQPQHISIYIHIPFCFQLCNYCGCNAVLLKDRNIFERYVQALKKEMGIVFPMLSRNRKVSQIHYGGGTPTSLPVSALEELNAFILSTFDTIENPEIAIECHPGYMDEDYWKSLSTAGFNRVSIGIQDFDEQVLKTVRRKPSRVPVESIIDWLRKDNISVNMDFIYGLPFQTLHSFADTIRRAITMLPDRVVTFSYAHVPWVNPLQKKLEEAGLPAPQRKNELFNIAAGLLTGSGYKQIGLDHFVLPDNELYEAVTKKTLHRNFQGYCTRRTTGQVYAFGATGISQLADSYSQNVKDISTYIEIVERGELPVLKGYSLNQQERIAREVISTLMCNYVICWEDIAKSLNKSVSDIKGSLNYNENVLRDFVRDGIIEFTENYIRVLPDARPFVRNVAASLDTLMVDSDKRFSKSI